MRSTPRYAAAVFASLALLVAAGPAVATPTPGAAGIGDPLQPELGNGGYDVLHYDLDLRYVTSDPAQPLDGDETILARATHSLSRFDLDFAGDSVGGVWVNGRRADFTREREELVITPRHALRNGKRFVVKITDFRATPTVPGDDPTSTAFFITPDGSATAPQPYYAHLVYPCNDHPRDKATFRFDFDVPEGTEAVANGVEVRHRTRDGRTRWSYVMRQPMATELTQLAVGNWDFSAPQWHHGVLVRDVTAPSLTASVQPALALEPGQLDYMEARVGRYPFDIFGSLILVADLGFALETQTISLLDSTWFTGYGQGVWDPTMLHELSHMWFGDSVAPYEWSDLWLNEGHASWYEFVYAEEKGFLEEDTTNYPDEQGYATLEGLMRAVYAHGDQWRHDSGPVAKPSSGDVNDLFSLNVYHGGALVLYALRQKIGKSAFERVERAWVHRYEGKSASTDDFIALAARVSHRHVTGFLRDWLYGETTPPMPGHPDWKTDPVVEQTTARALASTSMVSALQRRR
jgi:aminopeptidase N